MIKYKVKIKIHGNVNYQGKQLKDNQIVDEYDTELLQLVEQKLVKVEKVDVNELSMAMKEEKNKKKKKDSGDKAPELV